MDGKIEEKQKYQTLGKKVFWLFFLQQSPLCLILLLISLVLFLLSFQPFLTDTFFGNIQNKVIMATLIFFLLFLLTAIIYIIMARLIFKNYVFLMAEDSFKIKRGVFSKTENAIPYRQIQNVDIERDLMFQILGLSRLIILTAGREDEKSPKDSDEAEGIIPAMDQKLAEQLQAELLKRANTQKMVSQTNN